MFKKYNSIGKEELRAVTKVMKSGRLSGYVADKSKDFYGGNAVKTFESYLKKFYGVKFAITVNSWTSGLICMVGSLDVSPGDEIIVTPWTMSATVASILHWNCIPVFADINENDFCIDPHEVKKKITKRTKAIFAVDIFGRSSNVKELKKIVKGTNIKILIDSAQSPYCKTENGIAGTTGDIGGYSLNYHKIINTGEGGIIVTNNQKIAKRLCLLRNHAEITNSFKSKKDLSNMIGFNFRMGELEAAIGLEQYKKLKKILYSRSKFLNQLTEKLKKLKGLTLPPLDKIYKNNFYVYPFVLNLKEIKISRIKLISFLQKEGLREIGGGYANLHLLPALQKKIAFGDKNFPWSYNKSKISYKKGICPIAEKLHEKNFCLIEICMFEINSRTINSIENSFIKVWKRLKLL